MTKLHILWLVEPAAIVPCHHRARHNPRSFLRATTQLFVDGHSCNTIRQITPH